MSLPIEPTGDRTFIYQEASVIASMNELPRELLLEIFSYLNFTSLEASSLVSKEWKQLASDPLVQKKVVYQDIAFSNKKWAICFGKESVKGEDLKEEFFSLPNDIFKILKSPCLAFPGKRVIDTHVLVRIPKTLSGQHLTLSTLGAVAKRYFPDSQTGYGLIPRLIVNELGDKPLEKSQWVLMTKDVLPGSRKKKYEVQLGLVADLAKETQSPYTVPSALQAAVCILAQHFNFKTGLFSDKPWTYYTYTRCQENFYGDQVQVGSWDAEGGLQFDHTPSTCERHSIGMAALRKL
ncbi:F-box protein [Neochlamydia sp. S13]|uniref:F-box protein n=1 Tax=Neochlamydia sp. S13 TaxID=1353976 RepID=UPI0006945108|nr:F-box protein [Neochlamydia sp. S13]BBI17192.1 Uncharacterized protein NCS13_1_0997 [Neochlamydia sp. S13]